MARLWSDLGPIKMCKQQFLLIPSKPQKAAIAHHPERGPLVLSAFHCWILNNLLEWFNLRFLFILHSCLPVGPRSQIHSHSIISQCFPSCCFVKMSCCKFVNLSLFCSVCNWFVVGRELKTRAPDSFQLSQPRASLPQSRTTTEEVATESTKPLLCYSGFDKNEAFPWAPLLITFWTILSNSSQLVRFHAIQSNYSRKPDWRPLHFSLTRRSTAFLLSLGLQAP